MKISVEDKYRVSIGSRTFTLKKKDLIELRDAIDVLLETPNSVSYGVTEDIPEHNPDNDGTAVR